MSGRELTVLKFGSSVLRSEEDLYPVAGEIRSHVAAGEQVVAVVSAIGESTELLLDRARRLRVTDGNRADTGRSHGIDRPATAGFPDVEANSEPCPGKAALAALLATGEATSAALIGLALDGLGVPFTVLDAGRVGPFTHGPQLDAEPYWFDCRAVSRALDQRPVAVLPGFVGRDDEGNFSLLGRGGSDLTALFAAHCLGASRCRLVKDVDGVYEHDPAAAPTRPRRYTSLNWADALAMDDVLLQQKAIRFAHRHDVGFEVGACGSAGGTRVGTPTTTLAPTETASSPVGSVGSGAAGPLSTPDWASSEEPFTSGDPRFTAVNKEGSVSA